jgi:hypothetical protein
MTQIKNFLIWIYYCSFSYKVGKPIFVQVGFYPLNPYTIPSGIYIKPASLYFMPERAYIDSLRGEINP